MHNDNNEIVKPYVKLLDNFIDLYNIKSVSISCTISDRHTGCFVIRNGQKCDCYGPLLKVYEGNTSTSLLPDETIYYKYDIYVYLEITSSNEVPISLGLETSSYSTDVDSEQIVEARVQAIKDKHQPLIDSIFDAKHIYLKTLQEENK